MDWDDMEREAAADDRKKKREGEDEQDARLIKKLRRTVFSTLQSDILSVYSYII